ncbi:phosphonate C-P lyase system protein PhnH [Nioella nitratireducens]|uniref:phosphonate C-P lyase system protein PhnH n=1 Tax=Nioella nitratireducens TaxID=1287720 RepID=UPI0008FD762D|nr:phosphonate C-P lyase system protein PhnH [Nioella nitratireducens]
MEMTAMDGGFADAPREAALAFRAALQVLARPGRIDRLAGAAPPAPASPAAGALLLTLCDPETGVYLAGAHDTQALRQWITFHCGAPLVGPEQADFALGTWAALQPVGAYRIGTSEYPDRSATLIVETEVLDPAGARLTGPGIEAEAALSLPELAAFQANAKRFPLGFDCYFTCGDRVAGLPRSTTVTEAG